MKKFLTLIGVVSVVYLSACSSTSNYKGVYAETKTTTSLEVPPGLDKPDDKSAVLPELDSGPKSYSEYSNKGTVSKQGYLPAFKDMRFVRDGSLFWIEVKDYPENLWPDIRTFFQKLGFKMAYEQTKMGIMQTEWKENRQGLPTGWFMSWIGKLYSTGMMDSYRVRLEFDEDKAVARMFIAHRGLREVVEGEGNIEDVVQTKWIPRPADPELEIEMLMRFMMFRGKDEKEAQAIIAKVKTQQRATIVKQDDGMTLEVNDVFARAWRHVGIALDRMGVLVEDRNRSAGVYYIKLPETFEIETTSGLFSGLFSSKTKPSSDQYLLTIKEQGEVTQVMMKSRGEVGKDLPLVTQKLLTELQANIL